MASSFSPNITSDILVIGMDGNSRPDSVVPLGWEEELGARKGT
jgi:hypothetical protein